MPMHLKNYKKILYYCIYYSDYNQSSIYVSKVDYNKLLMYIIKFIISNIIISHALRKFIKAEKYDWIDILPDYVSWHLKLQNIFYAGFCSLFELPS
jgi:hypothetical protein